MRLLFLVASNAHKATAGSRIRYDRLASVEDYFDVSVLSLEEITSDDARNCDVCVLSKTYSLEALTIAQELKSKGKVVGIDLFDDYFSQSYDSRLRRFRQWLQMASEVVHFALCSTSAMRRLIEMFAPGLPVHMLPDPFPEIEPNSVARSLATKLERVHRSSVIDILWFGNGSNPFFPVGLHDLAAYSSVLHQLRSSRFTPRLSILTNKAAFTPETLARLSRLPVDYKLSVWSLEAEKEALIDAFVAFVPVNGQSFSRAKSLNRALSAISNGTQVLSPGFPLYRELAPAIYDRADELLEDIQNNTCRIRQENIDRISEVATDASGVESIGMPMFLFLYRLVRIASKATVSIAQQEQSKPVRRRALIYGVQRDSTAIRAARAMGVLSVKTPISRDERAYDIRVESPSNGHIEIWITTAVKEYLAPDLAAGCSAFEKKGKMQMCKVAKVYELVLPSFSLTDTRAIVQETEVYRRFLFHIERICRRVFPEIDFSVAEINAHKRIGSNIQPSPLGDQ